MLNVLFHWLLEPCGYTNLAFFLFGLLCVFAYIGICKILDRLAGYDSKIDWRCDK